jgi:nucleoside-diphosphate-sugar epimerase
MMGEQIFLTGGSGFVGAAFVKPLIAAGHRVRALARSEASAKALLAHGAEPVLGDLLDAGSLDTGARGATVVIHGAASLTSTSAVRFADHERTNVEGTRLLLAAAKRGGAKRFIYISAASIVIDAAHSTEGDELLPVQFDRSMPYSATKGVAERLVLDANQSSMVTLALRPSFVWGEGAPLIDEIGKAFRQGNFVWIGGGDFPYSVCHVDNLVSAVVRSIDHGVGGHPYFIIDDETSTMKSFITALMQAAGYPAKASVVPYWLAALLARVSALFLSVFRPGKRPPLRLEDVKIMGHMLRVSSARAKHELGYSPMVHLADGLERVRVARLAAT